MNKTSLYALLLGAALVPASAYAGGFQLSEYSASAIGRAFAGTGVAGDDYSAVAYNPAAMTLKNTGLQAVATYFKLHGHAYNLDNPGQNEGLLSTKVTVPAFFAQYKLNDKWHVGAGVYVPFGLGTNWKGRWFGDHEATDSVIEDVNYNLSVAYKATDKLSLGVSLIADAMHAELTNYAAQNLPAYSMMEADGFNVLWQAGLMYELSKDTRFGISYRPKSAQTLHGDHDITVMNKSGRVHTRLTLPEYVNASVYHKLNDSVALMAGARWTRWNRFKTLDIWSDAVTGNDATTGAVDEGWKNVWMFSAGADWYVNDQWTLRGGVAWDESPIRDSNHRTARIPDSSRVILSVGATYKTGNWTWDAAFSHLIMQKHDGYRPAGANPLAKPAFNFRRELDTNMVSLGVQYNF